MASAKVTDYEAALVEAVSSTTYHSFIAKMGPRCCSARNDTESIFIEGPIVDYSSLKG